MPQPFLYPLALTGLLACLSLVYGAPTGAGRMLQQLESENWIERAEALDYLGDHRIAEATGPVRALLAGPQTQPWVRGRALVALAAIENGVAPGEFGKWVAHDHPELRTAAAEVLEVHGGASAETWIKILLDDPDETVRYQAAAAHARRVKAAAWPVIDPLTRDPVTSQPRLAARALAWVGNKQALQRLAALLAHNDQLPQGLRGIGEVSNPELVPLLLEVLAGLSEDDDLRFGAVLTALQNQDWQDVISGLTKFIQKGSDRRVRTAARVMTLLTRAPELGEPLHTALKTTKDAGTIEAGLIALGSAAMKPDRHRDLFAAYLRHENSGIRALAIRCLAHCESVNLYDVLRESLADEDSEVVIAALGALLRSPVLNAPRGRLIHYLQEPLSSPNERIRGLAYELLGHAGSAADFRPAMAALSTLLRGKDDDLRAAAAKALGAIAPPEGIAEVVQAQGYVAKWRVIGTFLNDEKNTAFNQSFPPEESIDFDAKYLAEYVWVVEGHRKAEDKPIEREIEWTDGQVDQTDGRLIMSAQLPPPGSLAVGYAVADLDVRKAREVTLEVDGDDAFRVWLNGEQVAEQAAEYKARQPCVAQQSGIKLQLKPGNNRFLVKSANIDHHWWVRLRLTDSTGNPIDFNAP